MSSAPAQIAVTGLAVMGRNLARNLARNGFRVAVHNRTRARTDALVKEFGDEGEFVPAADLPTLVASLERPRKIIIMVQAGAPTDAVIDDLVPLLDEGDIVVDAGNAHFADTRRRENALKEHGLHFVGTGVSGGEEGALNGPPVDSSTWLSTSAVISIRNDSRSPLFHSRKTSASSAGVSPSTWRSRS